MSVTPVRLTVTKRLTFRGQLEETANQYTLQGLDKDSESAMNGLVDNALAAERAIHASNVEFVRAQIFSYGIGPNFTYMNRELLGNFGLLTESPSRYRETADLLRAKMERSFSLTRSSQPYLRKFIHSCATLGAGLKGDTAPSWAEPSSGPLVTYIAFLNAPASGVTLTNDAGDEPIGDWEYCNFLGHHQFRRGRKEY